MKNDIKSIELKHNKVRVICADGGFIDDDKAVVPILLFKILQTLENIEQNSKPKIKISKPKEIRYR